MESNMDESRKQFDEIYEQQKHDRFCSNEEWAWKFWQASRAALEIELPEPYDDGHGNLWLPQDNTTANIRAAGIKVKE